MDIFQFIQSINKVAIIVFFLTGFSLIYEIYLFIKESKSNKAKPNIRSLTESGTPYFQKKLNLTLKRERKKAFTQPNNYAIIILIVLLVIFGILFIIGTVTSEKSKQTNIITPSPSSHAFNNNSSSSEGIKIYTPLWSILGKSQLRFAKTGDVIIMSIKTIPHMNITKARIRVNSDNWNTNDETTLFNAQFNVFYRQHQIASNESVLKIEAELYSEKEGWFGK